MFPPIQMYDPRWWTKLPDGFRWFQIRSTPFAMFLHHRDDLFIAAEMVVFAAVIGCLVKEIWS